MAEADLRRDLDALKKDLAALRGDVTSLSESTAKSAKETIANATEAAKDAVATARTKLMEEAEVMVDKLRSGATDVVGTVKEKGAEAVGSLDAAEALDLVGVDYRARFKPGGRPREVGRRKGVGGELRTVGAGLGHVGRAGHHADGRVREIPGAFGHR